jgi:hypothetical protein
MERTAFKAIADKQVLIVFNLDGSLAYSYLQPEKC